MYIARPHCPLTPSLPRPPGPPPPTSLSAHARARQWRTRLRGGGDGAGGGTDGGLRAASRVQGAHDDCAEKWLQEAPSAAGAPDAPSLLFRAIQRPEWECKVSANPP